MERNARLGWVHQELSVKMDEKVAGRGREAVRKGDRRQRHKDDIFPSVSWKWMFCGFSCLC